MPRQPSLERLRALGYPVHDDGSMVLPPPPRFALGSLPLRDQFAHVERLPPAERVAAMYRGELTYTQLCRWAAGYPDEVGIVDGELVFIAIGLPEVADSLDSGEMATVELMAA